VASAVGLAGYYALRAGMSGGRRCPRSPGPRAARVWTRAAVGVGLFTIVFGILLLFGFNHLEGVRGWAGVPVILAVSIISALWKNC